MQPTEAETLAKVEVLADLEPVVDELMHAHEAKRILWFPSELLSPAPDTDPERHVRGSFGLAQNGLRRRGSVAVAATMPARANFEGPIDGRILARRHRDRPRHVRRADSVDRP